MKHRLILEFDNGEDLETFENFLLWKVEGKYLFNGRSVPLYKSTIEDIREIK